MSQPVRITGAINLGPCVVRPSVFVGQTSILRYDGYKVATVDTAKMISYDNEHYIEITATVVEHLPLDTLMGLLQKYKFHIISTP